MTVTEIPWGPTGELVYDRTYSRPKPDGSKETWPETVRRVVDGNLALVPEKYVEPGERELLIEAIENFRILPGGRHLWASGVKGRQYLFNCHVAGWGEKLSDHFEFTFLRLMEGGGVGTNYSEHFLVEYGPVLNNLEVHIVCDPEHKDYAKLKEAGVLSNEYDSSWIGSFDVDDSREGWAAALVDLLDSYYRPVEHTKRVFDVSRVREEGARLKQFGGRASGPLSLSVMLREIAEVMNHTIGVSGMDAMAIDHAIAKCVVSGGVRRSARMSIMHWSDSEIFEFLDCKEEGDFWTTNISVELDDRFWENYNSSDTNVNWKAHYILRTIADNMLDNGEPGFWNSSLSQLGEPNEVIATNPCGEITLEAWENCNLGHVNLAAFVNEDNVLDIDGLAVAHRLVTRFLIRATFGDVNDPKQASVLARNRRIGVGHLGYASALALMGIKYSDAPNDEYIPLVLDIMKGAVQREAFEYSFQLRIPMPVKTTTVAPTGTIAKLPGVTEGIHPLFAKYFIRRIRFSDVDPDQWATALDYASKGYHVESDVMAPQTTVVAIPTEDILMGQVREKFGDELAEEIVQTPDDLTLDQLWATQQMYQKWWADNAVSFTANVNTEATTLDDVVAALEKYGKTLKGGTVFPEKGYAQAPYQRLTLAEYVEHLNAHSIAGAEIGDSVDPDCASGACPVR